MAEDTQARFQNLLANGNTGAIKPEAKRTKRGVMSVVGQGLSLGTADEIEAFLRSKLNNQDYDTVLKEIRDSIEGYRTANPIQSTVVEAGSAAIPMGVAAFFTGGSSLIPTVAANATRFPVLTNIMRALGIVPTSGLRNAAITGASTGSIYGFASGENGAFNRLQSAGFDALGGAIAGPVAELGGQLVGGLVVGVIDQARRLFGNRGSILVERELQRIAKETGQSIDDVVQQIYDGNILAENATLREVIKSYAATGGEEGTRLRNVLESRSNRLSREAGNKMQTTLSNVPDDNIKKANEELAEAARTAENAAYDALEKPIVSKEITNATTRAVNKVPSSVDEINMALQAAGSEPLYVQTTLSSTGKKVWVPTRRPTVKEVEIIQRTIGDQASNYFSNSKGTLGRNLEDVSKELEKILDLGAPEAQDVRKMAALNRNTTEAFNNGAKAFTAKADEVEIAFEKAVEQGAEVVKTYRGGVMHAIRRKLSSPQRASFLRRLATAGTDERRILEIIAGEDELASILRAVVRSDRSTQAFGAVKEYGAAKTKEAVKNQGSNVGLGDAMSAAMYGDPAAIIRIIAKQLDTTQPGLSPSDRSKVLDVLLSNDPDFVRRMLQDEGGMMRLQEAIQNAVSVVRGGVTRAGQQIGAIEMDRLQSGQNPALMQGLLGGAY